MNKIFDCNFLIYSQCAKCKSIKIFSSVHKFQGILGLAYPVLAELSPEASGKPWLEAVDKELGQTTSFALKLCGVRSATNATHYGSFTLFGK